MSNPFNPFQTRSALRFPPGAQKRLCKLLIIKHLQGLSFFVFTKFGHLLVTFLLHQEGTPTAKKEQWGFK